MKDLEYAVQKSLDNKASLGLIIEMPEFPKPEMITNPIENLEKKLDYWKKTYDENLEHKHAKGIKIIGCTIDLSV